MTRSVRYRLVQRMPPGSVPTHEQIARIVHEPALRRHLKLKLKRAPTAVDMQAGWKEMLPKYVHRVAEDLARVPSYAEVQEPLSLDAVRDDAKHRVLNNRVADSDDLRPGPHKQLEQKSLSAHLRQALTDAGLDEVEQFILVHRWGVFGVEPLTLREMASRLPEAQADADPERYVQARLSAVIQKIQSRPDLMSTLAEFL